MAFAAGTFSLYTPGNPTVTGTTISSTWANNTLTDIATGLSSCVLKDGTQTITANIPFNTFKLTGLGAGVAATDAAQLQQIYSANYLTAVSGTNTVSATSAITIVYTAGQQFTFLPANSNTGASTLNISGVGAKNIFLNGVALTGYEMKKNIPVTVAYDGTQFNIIAGAFGGDGVPIATVIYTGSATAAPGYLASGQTYSRTTYADLFAVIGTTFNVGGEAGTDFRTPPSPGRSIIGVGTGTVVESPTASSANGFTVTSNNAKWITGQPIVISALTGFTTTATAGPTYFVVRVSATNIRLATTLALAQAGTPDITLSGTGTATLTGTLTARTLGEIGGEETHAMTVTELLAHVHVQTNAGSSIQHTDAAGTTSPRTSPADNTASTGGNVASNNMQPFVALNAYIKF